MKESKLVSITITISILCTYGTIAGGYKTKRSIISDIATLIPSLSDTYTYLINGTVHLMGNCSAKDDTSRVEYWLYTRKNSDGELLEGVDGVDSKKALKVLIHGWYGSKNASYLADLKEAYLKRFDNSVIIVDYGPYAMINYPSAVCNAPYVAQNLANFLCELESKRNLKISSIHILGHSLGGHVAGMAGQGTQDICNKKVGRITGLDPAGPLFQGVSPTARLDKSDATFVDIIHTNRGLFGYIGDLGDVDFYPNGGTVQPGCMSVYTNYTALVNNTFLGALVELSKNFVTCNHQRSCFLFAESISVDSFYSTSVSSCFLRCVPDDTKSATHCYMGENLRSRPSGNKTQFTCSTNDQPKYGKGPDKS